MKTPRRGCLIPDGVVLPNKVVLHVGTERAQGSRDALVDRGLFLVREDPLHVSGLVESAGTSQDGIHVELLKRLVAHPRGIVLREILVRLVHGIRQRADVGHDLPDRAIRQPAAALFEIVELLCGQRVNLAVGACLSGLAVCPLVKETINIVLEALDRRFVLALQIPQHSRFHAEKGL